MKRQRVTPERLAKVAKCAAEGWTAATTARAMGISKARAHALAVEARKAGLNCPSFGREMAYRFDPLEAVRLSRQMTRREVAAKIGAGYASVCRCLAEMEEVGAAVGKRREPEELRLPEGTHPLYRKLRRNGLDRAAAVAGCHAHAAAAAPPAPPAMLPPKPAMAFRPIPRGQW